MKFTAVFLAVLALTGCGSMKGLTFENRVACTVAKDKVFVVSEYGGWIGISSVISEKDRPKLVEACKS